MGKWWQTMGKRCPDDLTTRPRSNISSIFPQGMDLIGQRLHQLTTSLGSAPRDFGRLKKGSGWKKPPDPQRWPNSLGLQILFCWDCITHLLWKIDVYCFESIYNIDQLMYWCHIHFSGINNFDARPGYPSQNQMSDPRNHRCPGFFQGTNSWSRNSGNMSKGPRWTKSLALIRYVRWCPPKGYVYWFIPWLIGRSSCLSAMSTRCGLDSPHEN